MKLEIRTELTRQLEKIRLSNEGANSRLLFLIGALSEIVASTVFFILAIRLAVQEDLLWAAFLVFLAGVTPLAHAAYLSFNRFLNRRLRLLYEAVLDTPPAEER